MKARLVAEPCKKDEIGRRRRPKARRTDIDGGAGASLVNVHRLDLKSDNPPTVEVHHGQLRRLERDDTRAVDRLTDPGVFFEDADVKAGLGQVCRREEAGGTTADDRDVQHDGQYKGRLVTAKL